MAAAVITQLMVLACFLPARLRTLAVPCAHEALDGDGDFHYFPEQLMLDFVPKLVQERYGRVEETAFNGPMLILDPDHESKIVAVLRNCGFSVQRNDALMEALYA